MQSSSKLCIYDNPTTSWFRIDTSACFHAKSNEIELSEINIRSRNRFVRDLARRVFPLSIQAHRSLPAAAHHVWDFCYHYDIYIANYRVIITSVDKETLNQGWKQVLFVFVFALCRVNKTEKVENTVSATYIGYNRLRHTQTNKYRFCHSDTVTGMKPDIRNVWYRIVGLALRPPA